MGGFLFGFLGVGVLFATDIGAIGPDAVPTGLILLLSPAISALGTAVVKRRGAHVSSILLNRNGMFLGALLLCLMAGLFERDQAAEWTPRAIGTIVYLALAGTVVTFTLYFWLMRYAPAYKLSLIAYITPAIAIALGVIVGDEPVTVHTLGGAALILVGVSFVMLGKPAKPSEPRAHS